MPKKIDELTKTNIVQKYGEGEPLRKMEEELHISQATILRIVKESGIPLRDGPKPVHENKRTMVNELYASGHTIHDIMEQTGILSESTIYRYLDADIRRRRS